MKVSSSSKERPLIVSESTRSMTRLFAYYAVHWEQKVNETNEIDAQLEINSCLYFQTDLEDDLEEIREDGCGYVVTYPPHLQPTDHLQIYNFDREKGFLLTSDEVYRNSKNHFVFLFFFRFVSFRFLKQKVMLNNRNSFFLLILINQ